MCAHVAPENFLCPPPYGGHFGIARSVRLSVPWCSCPRHAAALGYRHAGCLQLSHVQTVNPPADGRTSAASETAISGDISSRRPHGVITCTVLYSKRCMWLARFSSAINWLKITTVCHTDNALLVGVPYQGGTNPIVQQRIEGFLDLPNNQSFSFPCKKVAHTRLPSVGFRSWSRFLAVSLQVTHTRLTALFRDYPGEPVPER